MTELKVSGLVAEVWAHDEPPPPAFTTLKVSQLLAEIWVAAPEVVMPCYTVQTTPNSVASRYYLGVYNQAGVLIDIFDDWLSLEYGLILDGVGYCALTIRGDDSRIDDFVVDGYIRIFRSVPHCGLGWYKEFAGLIRSFKRNTDQNGTRTFSIYAAGFNDLLFRTYIMYKQGYTGATKSGPAETVLIQFVKENCGEDSIVAKGRVVAGVLPGFDVATDSGFGALWEGDRSFQNLLDVALEIANFAQLDFDVVDTENATFLFTVYPGQLGLDCTVEGLNEHSGKNTAGNVPIVFSIPSGNVQEMEYSLDRSKEVNVVAVLGPGSGSTRTVLVVTSSAKTDSPLNRRETVREASGNVYQYQQTIAGLEVLSANRAAEGFTFKPLQQEACLYGKHYKLGYKVTALYDDIQRNKRIVSVKNTISNGYDDIQIEFMDIA